MINTSFRIYLLLSFVNTNNVQETAVGGLCAEKKEKKKHQKRALLVAADTFSCTWLNLNFAIRHENEYKKRTASRVRRQCSHQQTESRWWKLWKACSVRVPSALMIISKQKERIFTCSISRSSCWIISFSRAWKRFCRRKTHRACSSPKIMTIKKKNNVKMRWPRGLLPGLLTSPCPLWQREHLED